jgi:iron complex outermembrane receptor protein
VNASAARVDDWRLPRDTREAFLAPAISWQPRPAVRVVLEGEMLRARAAGDPGVAIPDASAADRSTLPAITGAGLFYGEPGAAYDWRSDFGMATFEAILAAGWSLRAVTSAGRHAFSRETVQLVGMAAPDSVARQFRVESTDFRYLQAEGSLAGTLRTGPVAHGLTAGIEAVRLAADVSNTAPLVQRGGVLDFATIRPVALDDPAPAGLPTAATLVEYTFADGSGVNAGLFVQDRMTLRAGSGLVHVVASARASYVTAGAEWFALVATDESPAGLNDRRVSLTAVTPGLGVLWEPAAWASAYASYGRSFNPIFQQVSPSGEPFDPTEGEGAEAGIKLDARRGRAALTVFHLEKSGALSQRGDGSYVQTGRQRSRGAELEVVAEPIAGLSVAGAYTFTDAVVTADEQVPVGSRLPGAPRHSAGAWVEARPAGALRGLALTAGWRFVDAREALLSNTVRLPAHTVVDVGASFRAGRYLLRLAVDNLLDERYAVGADRHPGSGPGPALLVAWPGARRTVRVGLEVAL